MRSMTDEILTIAVQTQPRRVRIKSIAPSHDTSSATFSQNERRNQRMSVYYASNLF